MRQYQRKTLVKKEQWTRIDDWYWCPEFALNERFKKEKKRLRQLKKIVPGYSSVMLAIMHRQSTQIQVSARLAHHCDDGKIRAPSGVQIYRKKEGTLRIYGRCRYCKKNISNGMKAIIILESVV